MMILFFIASFIQMIVFRNMFIAMIADTFCRVIESKEEYEISSMFNVISEYINRLVQDGDIERYRE